MVFVNSKVYNKMRFLLLSLRSSDIYIYGMHTTVFPFLQIVGLAFFLKMMAFISLLVRRSFIQVRFLYPVLYLIMDFMIFIPLLVRRFFIQV